MIHQLKIQELLRKTKGEFVSADKTVQILKTNKNNAIEILTHLEDTGYLEKIFDGIWQHSLRGKILANKKLDKVFKVDTLRRQLNNLIKRSQIVNSSPEYPDYINCVLITTEYPITQKSNGINIAYSICPKGFSSEAYEIAADALRKRYSGNFNNIVEYYSYPKEAIRLFLKSKSPVLKLIQYRIDEMQAIAGHKIFEYYLEP